MTTQTYRRARHSVALLHTHLVFVTKHRRPVSTDAMLTHCHNTMRSACDDLNAELIEFDGETDHLHLLVAYPPTPAISALAQHLKSHTAYTVRREFTGVCVPARMRGHLWSPPYLAASRAGTPLSITNQYIKGQARPP